MAFGADSSPGYPKTVVTCTIGSHLTIKKNWNNTEMNGKYHIVRLYIIIIHTLYVYIALNGINHEESEAGTCVTWRMNHDQGDSIRGWAGGRGAEALGEESIKTFLV